MEEIHHHTSAVNPTGERGYLLPSKVIHGHVPPTGTGRVPEPNEAPGDAYLNGGFIKTNKNWQEEWFCITDVPLGDPLCPTPSLPFPSFHPFDFIPGSPETARSQSLTRFPSLAQR